ncbi:MAG: thiamine pyrophosphate-dependent enzyme [Spirochaetaceae bacterium]|jgi:indolepyruvate ferredoxin oxidoreductase alpha subunit|nr:thiamine pyrophosphate-dependent enzyme [Spirochaetaceae bacterium]
MSELVLLGDEAVAQGAIDAGLSIAYGYPGTPSTEIVEYLQEWKKKEDNTLVASWCSNEKTAYEAAVAVSMMGKRALVTMKHVGLNVAADAFMNSIGYRIHGGLVLAVADDPGMHSSQNEQDSRYYADFARTICLEPRNQQETYEMTKDAFELSETLHLPVLLKLTTRISHSRAVVKRGPVRPKNKFNPSKDRNHWTSLPYLSRQNYENLWLQRPELAKISEKTVYNPLVINENNNELAVITTGLAYNYYKEAEREVENKPSHLHISFYPMPEDKIRKLAQNVKRIIVIEEGYPFVERFLKGILTQSVQIDGKLNDVIPHLGEINPDICRKALDLPVFEKAEIGAIDLPGRPPQLCKGCPHTDSYKALNMALKDYDHPVVTSDIGCYTLGFFAPHNAIHSCLDMGASVTMARGAAEAGAHPVVGVIGDGTFMHTGIQGLVDMLSAGNRVTLVILDNSITAMTGMQDTIVESSRILEIVKGCGVDPEHINVLIPLPKNLEENIRVIKEEVEYDGVSVIIQARDCVHVTKKRMGKR